MKQSTINPSEEYKYGFTTDIESIRAPKGLNEDVIKLEEIFTKTKKIRKEIVKAGQDVGKPDFGRK